MSWYKQAMSDTDKWENEPMPQLDPEGIYVVSAKRGMGYDVNPFGDRSKGEVGYCTRDPHKATKFTGAELMEQGKLNPSITGCFFFIPIEKAKLH